MNTTESKLPTSKFRNFLYLTMTTFLVGVCIYNWLQLENGEGNYKAMLDEMILNGEFESSIEYAKYWRDKNPEDFQRNFLFSRSLVLACQEKNIYCDKVENQLAKTAELRDDELTSIKIRQQILEEYVGDSTIRKSVNLPEIQASE